MKITFELLFFVISFQCFSTPQVKDILIIKRDTFSINQLPLENYPQIDSILKSNNIIGTNSSCYRGYIGEWKIIKNKLYLNKLSCCSSKCVDFHLPQISNNGTWDLRMLFPIDQIDENGLQAFWFSEKMIVQKGEIFLSYVENRTLTSREEIFQFNKGELQSKEKIENLPPIISQYSQFTDSGHYRLEKYIYSHIDWDSVQFINSETYRIVFQISSKSDTSNIAVQILKSSGVLAIDREITRVLKNIPNWDVFYLHGQEVSIIQIESIVLKEEYRIAP